MKRFILLAICAQLSLLATEGCHSQYKIYNDSPYDDIYISSNYKINSSQFVSLTILENSPNIEKVKKGRKSAQVKSQTIFIYTPTTNERGRGDKSGRFEQKWMIFALKCNPLTDASAMAGMNADIKYSDIANNALDKRKFALKSVTTNPVKAEHVIEKQHPSQPSYWVTPGGYNQIIP
jgi:hypothetical protein